MLVSGEKKNGHGGARRGAGRKPIDTKQPSTTITLRVPLRLREELREYTNNPHFRGMAFTGIRGDESASRSEYEGISHGEKVRGQYSCHPILEWNSLSY